MPADVTAEGPLAESDERNHPEDNSVGRLLTLSDGVFAIAMTLLALDLKVPSLHGAVNDEHLRHALGANADSYFSYLITFYVVANYWYRHRRVMRSVVATQPTVIRLNMLLLLLIAAMPFPASLLGNYGGLPFALALYGAVNAVATVVLILLARDVRRFRITDRGAAPDPGYDQRWEGWLNVAVFLLCIPAGYVLGHKGPYVLVLLAVPARWTVLTTRVARWLPGRARRSRPRR